MKKLSICLPTYNRSEFLDALLASLVTQIADSERADDIELLVSDNCSPDDTPSIAAKYESSIRYWRNTENIGPDANFLKLFAEATGAYIWLPGDDDNVRSDTVKFLMRMIDEHEFDFLYLRSQGLTAKGWRQRDATVMGNVELLRRVNIMTTFMTSQVVRADLIKPKLESARVHLGGFMAYYWIFLEALYSSSKCLISEEREVFPQPAENTGGYRFYQVWGRAVFDVLKASRFGDDTRTVTIMRLRMFLDLLLPITYRLRSGEATYRFEVEHPATALEKYFGGAVFRTIMSTHLTFPVWLLRPIHLATRIASRVNRFFVRNIV